MNWKILLFSILAVFTACVVSCSIWGRKAREKGREEGYTEGFEAGYAAPHPADTVWRIDTLRDPVPVPVAVTPAGYELAPIGTIAELRAQVDSLAASHPDTVEVYRPVPIERKEYRKPNYYAVVTGWHPELAYIETYAETEQITTYIDRPFPVDRPVPYAWKLSAKADALAAPGLYDARAGLRFDKQARGPFRWSVEGGYHVGNTGHGPYVQGGIELEILKK